MTGETTRKHLHALPEDITVINHARAVLAAATKKAKHEPTALNEQLAKEAKTELVTANIIGYIRNQRAQTQLTFRQLERITAVLGDR